MDGCAEISRLFRRNSRIRHARQLFLKVLVDGLDPVMQIANERLGLEYAVDEPVAIAVAERTDTRIQHAVDRAKIHRYDFSLVLIELAKRAGRKTDLRAVLHERKKQIPLGSTLDAPFGGGSQNTAAADPCLVVVFLERQDPDTRIIRLDIRIIRMLEPAERAAGLNHLLVEAIDLALEKLVRIRTLVAVDDLRLGVYALEDIHRRLVLALY